MSETITTGVDAPVLVETRGTVATVTLNRPERRNAIDSALAEALTAALTALAADVSTRCVVITGAGDHFSVGGDLRTGSGGIDQPDEEAAAAELRAAMESAYLLHTMEKPTVAVIRGACAGADLSLACAADLRVVGASARFSTAFVGAGVSGDYGGTWTLPRVVGPAKARELFLLSTRFSAADADRAGLVSRLCPDAELDATAAEITDRLTSLPPLAVSAAKANLNDGVRSTLAEHLDIEAARHARTALSSDAAEAAAAFLEKRPAVFRGE